MEGLVRIHNAPSPESAVQFVTPEITRLYRGFVNTPEQLLDTIRLKMEQGFSSIGIVIPPGEEVTVMEALSKDLVSKIHRLS
jgi:hypothetical protein